MEYGRRPQYFWKWKTTSTFWNWKKTSKFLWNTETFKAVLNMVRSWYSVCNLRLEMMQFNLNSIRVSKSSKSIKPESTTNQPKSIGWDTIVNISLLSVGNSFSSLCPFSQFYQLYTFSRDQPLINKLTFQKTDEWSVTSYQFWKKFVCK